MVADDDFGGGDGDGFDAEFVDGGGNERSGKAFADAGDGVEGARGKFAEHGGAAEEALKFGEDFADGGGGFFAGGEVVAEGFEGGDVLSVKFGDERGDEALFALLGFLGGGDEAVGDAGHGGDDGDDRALGGCGFDDSGGASDAVGVADRGAPEFHDLEGGRHCAGLNFRTGETNFLQIDAGVRDEMLKNKSGFLAALEMTEGSVGRRVVRCGSERPAVWDATAATGLFRDEFEDGVVGGDGAEGFDGRVGRDREEFFDGAGVAVEIFLEKRRLVGVGDGLECEGLAEAGALQDDFVGGFGVADPLGATSGGDEYFLAGDLHKVDGGAIDLAAFAAAHFELINETWCEAESGQEAEGAVEHRFEPARRVKFPGIFSVSHTCNRNRLSESPRQLRCK